MINAGKVRLMSELNLYEKTKGREAIKLNKSIKHMHGSEGVKNVIFGIITYLLLIFIVVAAKYDEVSEIYENIGFVISGVILLAGMVIFVIAYFFFAGYMLNARHEKVKGNLWKYNFTKKKLRDVLIDERIGNEETAGAKQ